MVKLYLKHFLFFLIAIFSGEVATAQNAAGYHWNNLKIGGGGFVSAIVPSKTEQNLIYARTDVGGAYRWDSDNEEWIPLLDWVADNETGYLGVESLATDPQQPNIVYMLVGISYFDGGKTAFLKSEDYGETFSVNNITSHFKAHGNGMGRQTGEKLVVDPNDPDLLYCGTRWNGLYKSTNAGEDWSRSDALDVTTTPNENGISFVVLDPSTGSDGTPTQTLFIGVSQTGNNLYRSDDSGELFSLIAGGPEDLMPQRAVLSSDGFLYITYGNGAGPHGHWAVPEPMDEGGCWKYNVATEEWTDITPSGYSNAFGGISLDPNDPDRLVLTTINTWLLQDDAHGDRIFLSEDGGENWTDLFAEHGMIIDDADVSWINGHAIHWTGSVEFDPFDSQKVWVTSGNGIFSTEDIEAEPSVWKFTVKGLEETVPLDLVSIKGGPVVTVIGDYDGFRHENVDTYAPIHTPRMGTTTGLAVAGKDPDVMLRAGDKLYYSEDMGLTWTECTANGQKGMVAVSADGNIFLHSPENSIKTYRSLDRGVSWTEVTGLSINKARPVADQVAPDRFYAYNPANGSVMISTDGGVSFSSTGSTGSSGSKIIRTIPGKKGHIWVALYGGGLAYSMDSGETFSIVEEVAYCAAIGYGKADLCADYPTLYIWGTVNGTRGLHRSTDMGYSWIRVNDDAHQYGGPGNGQFVVGDMNVFGRVYMSTAGRGVVYGVPAPEEELPCEACPVTPFASIDNGAWEENSDIEVSKGASVSFDLQPYGEWSWTGPNDFSALGLGQLIFDNVQPGQAGPYTAIFTNSCGEESTHTFNLAVATVTGIDESLDKTIRIYPNPAANDLYIEHTSQMKEVSLIDISGQRVIKLTDRESGSPFNIEEVPAGLYILEIHMKDGTIFREKMLKN